jgi:hypothetical protein
MLFPIFPMLRLTLPSTSATRPPEIWPPIGVGTPLRVEVPLNLLYHGKTNLYLFLKKNF